MSPLRSRAMRLPVSSSAPSKASTLSGASKRRGSPLMVSAITGDSGRKPDGCKAEDSSMHCRWDRRPHLCSTERPPVYDRPLVPAGAVYNRRVPPSGKRGPAGAPLPLGSRNCRYRGFGPSKRSMRATTTSWMVLAIAMPLEGAAQAVESSGRALLPEVVVSATRDEAREFDLPVAIDSVEARVVREGNARVNLSESLNRVPGIVVQNRQNYAQDLQVSSRGFGARAAFGVRGVRLVADGIPATMPGGQGQSATFSLSSASRIEVLRGPFASLYGNASGGFIQTFTEDGPERPTLRPSVSFGSYDSY